jgi:hypothetical protein
MIKKMLVAGAVLMGLFAMSCWADTGTFDPLAAAPQSQTGMTDQAGAAPMAISAASATTAQWLPLKVNNIWRYRETVTGRQATYFKCRVIGTSVRAGTTWYPICWGEGGDAPQTIYYQHIAQGLREATQREANAGSGDFAIKFPLNTSNVWWRGDVMWTIDSTNAKTTVPAGTYTGCLQVLKFDNSKITYRWYAPRVGIVRQEMYDWNGRLLDRVVLESCCLVP